MKTTLKRTVNGKERYYVLELIGNLFNEYLVIRTYGAYTNSKPTRVISEMYPTLIKAKEAMETILHEKQKRGYAYAQQ
ncbi:MAG TPA: WGR domain-containing protein [Sulfuricurvum sp.]|nr:MAG: hypothetical protein B7Y30_06795 [Campylobacterales bacterium 16-40-21]OYZ59361.1 MAG: hypothetical protein B7Y17_05525 [Sulfuricurvum sp. 24-42-5]OZA02207.1 MAG: hypothetical protein B7X89_10260 [Sulfuricurvum sp. 17-40-25]HQS67799.1 WGR domain-containing protein [Sulfuricurvum sp.]HQT36304.1 WGR domain-containing protein [Sulfuricurvum sp.]